MNIITFLTFCISSHVLEFFYITKIRSQSLHKADDANSCV